MMKSFLAACAALLALPALRASDESMDTQANVPVEIALEAEGEIRDPDTLEVDAVFTSPSGRERRVPAFWSGDQTWKVRYASSEIGEHRFRAEVSRGVASGLGGIEGRVTVGPYTGDNPLYVHGPLQVSENRRHFEHADGTPFFWLGDTWWMGLSKRLNWPHGFQALAADRRDKGFTVVQIVGGLSPDMLPLDPRGDGDGGQPWTAGFGALRPEFYNAADHRILHLVDQGLVPCIVGAWKDYLPVMGTEKMKRHWRNLVARYGAYPVVWVIGGEVNRTRANPRFLDGGEPALSDNEASYRGAWTEVTRYVKKLDPFGRVIGAHNQGDYHVLDDPSLLDMYFLQTGHSALFSLAAQTQWFDELYHAEHRAPLVLSEANYQGLFAEGSYGDQLQRHQFWATMLDGGAGHTYGANGIWQVNQPGKPYGASPHGQVWGNTPWPEAMGRLASSQLGWGKAFLQQGDWMRLQPASEKVRFAELDLPPLAETGAQWIWPSDPGPGVVLMGTDIKLPPGGTVRRATLRIACDAPYELSVNDQMVHRIFRLDVSKELRHAPHWEFPLLGEYLTPGRNIIRLRFDVDDFSQGDGLLVHVRVEMADGEVIDVVSNPRWRWTNPESAWPGNVLEMDPLHGWPRVGPAEREPAVPENAAFRQFAPYGPRCAEIPGEEWLVYAPAAQPVTVTGLLAKTALTLTRFNPRTGEVHKSERARTDSDGGWRWDPPQESGDWVLRLTRR